MPNLINPSPNTIDNHAAELNQNQLDTPIVILMTHAPSHPSTSKALAYAQSIYKKLVISKDSNNICINDEYLKIFLYSDAVMLANRLIWLPADIENMAKSWQEFAISHHLTIQVCVSAALARGVTDAANAARHSLHGDNLAEGFELVGLGELAVNLHRATTVYQF